MTNPLISICLPAYNTESFITDCIESLLSQTYENIEILICDDGSTDSTKEKLEKYKLHYKIKIYHNDTNQGIAYTRNKLLKKTNGKYIALMDSDDICEPERIACQLNLLENTIYDFCATDAYIVDQYNNIIGYWKTPSSIEELKILLTIKIPFPQPSIMFKRQLLPLFSYDENELAEDYLLWMKISNRINYTTINTPHLRIRINSGSISKIRTSELLDSANRVRCKWIKENFFHLNKSQEYDLACTFSQDNSRNISSLKESLYILEKIKKTKSSDTINQLFHEQYFWLILRHTHLGLSLLPIIYKYRKQRSIKKSMILYIMSILKIKYGSNTFNTLKGLIRKNGK
ncbi:hypothetical protein TUM12149_34780 [Morganella morganii]|uniref:glycosyltransferase family 2 protein n=3 Tax=Enterobacterales TaxID=91347 RepID=UPI001BDA47DA|nr:glycosyltransferase family 2 protein [Morganella morganii]MBT0318163.1 glycosyltransferase family 2 protein [Morganella morganii subsp. morganii]MBT0346290.1 glycosyltransferase family 2 protein [Morganella morganii subsp. morganii]GIZ29508.1 hypothetical protein TUM12149_34780 [Morganella morganii]GIZ33010.1 hypothetical protein TUM12150_34960 [Morganella morganii]